MEKIFEKYWVKLSSEELQKFQDLLSYFTEINSQVNLSAIRDEEGIIEKHFVDSVILRKYVEVSGKVLDMWTGGGFPGVPLKIMDKNNSEFLLVDSIWKKIKIVNDFISKLWLENIKAIQSRAEVLWHDKNYREQMDYIVSRATAYMPVLLEFTMPLLKVGWTLIAYKLDNQKEFNEAKKALEVLGGEIEKIETYELWDTERSFVFIKKVKATPKKYPRDNGTPLKNPII